MSKAAFALGDLENFYDVLAETIDAVPEDKSELMLVKLALLLANEVGDAGVVMRALEAARTDL